MAPRPSAPSPVQSPVLPRPGRDDAAFWAGCKRHELLIQRCTACGTLRYWDRPMCSQCNSFDSEAIKASGRGTIWSFTTTHRAFSPVWKEAIPYTVIVVELDEGPRMTSTLLAASDEIRIGRNVEVVFADVSAEIALPKFRIVA